MKSGYFHAYRNLCYNGKQNGLFEVVLFTGVQLGLVVLLAFLPTLVIQLYKSIRAAVKR